MKHVKKFASLVMALLLLFSMAACGEEETFDPNSIVEDTTTLDIMCLHKGYGFQWLTALKEGFEAANPGVEVKITTISKSDIIRGDIRNYKKSETDLYFDIYSTGMGGLVQEYSSYYGGKQALRPLNEVMATQIPGEGITVADKLHTTLLAPYQSEGRDTADTADDVYYGLPYMQGTMGMYYNETVINEALGEGNWKVPNTTDELIALCQKLKDAGCYMLVPGELDQYTRTMFIPNWAQYEGFDNWLKFYEGVGYDKDRSRESQLSSLIYQQTGRLESLKVAYDLISPENGFVLSNSAEIGTNNLNDYQKRFVDPKNKLALYPCGDWLMQELKDNSGETGAASTIKMMKTPVISSIIDRVNGYSADQEARLPNISDDATLSAVIDYVDGASNTLPAGVTEAEVAFVKQARNTISSQADMHMVYAPEFSDAKALADKFLVYMASNEG
ncbi:MAG: extracellular solute-binding protein, partial [Oscillospiraceae bacterium]|nr:extracellular solute-binding protein [Oscillospiraceae bacterium]